MVVKDVNNQSSVRVEAHATGMVSSDNPVANDASVRLDVDTFQKKENSAGAALALVSVDAPRTSTSLSLESSEDNDDDVHKSGCRPYLHRVKRQWNYEWELLKRSWYIWLFTAVFQYVHSCATNLVYYIHVPSEEPIKDLGFELLTPALTDDQQILSEICFTILIVIVVGFAFLPLFFPKDHPTRFVIVYGVRYARVLVMAQALRCVSFLVTVLPSPNFHCREGAEEYDPPANVGEIFTRFDAGSGCGDLIFSSHTIFCTLGCCLIHHYNPKSSGWWYLMECTCWVLLIVLGFLVVAARKHYTVDIIVAWYTCPLLWFYVAKTWGDDKPLSLRQGASSTSTTRSTTQANNEQPAAQDKPAQDSSARSQVEDMC